MNFNDSKMVDVDPPFLSDIDLHDDDDDDDDDDNNNQNIDDDDDDDNNDKDL